MIILQDITHKFISIKNLDKYLCNITKSSNFNYLIFSVDSNNIISKLLFLLFTLIFLYQLIYFNIKPLMSEVKTIPTFKILILGDTNVGKSSLFLRYMKDEFKEVIANTVAINYDFKEIFVNGEAVHLKIWDTAGQEKFRSIVSQLYRDADGFILVYDVNTRRSFSSLTHLVKQLKDVINPKFTVVVGNKIDTIDEELLVQEEKSIKEFATENKFKYFLVSAKTGNQVNEIFETLSKSLYKNKEVKVKGENALKRGKKWKKLFCL